MKVGKILLWLFLVILLGIQFIRPAQNKTSSISHDDVTTGYHTPVAVQDIFKRACNDCHSNNTVYPWYANIQPVAWWLNKHIIDGKRHLNFNEFMRYPIARQYKKLKETADLVEKEEMPLTSYTIIHKTAKLSAQEKQLISNWCEEIRVQISSKYPPDSLVAKKGK